ncbi:MAG: glycosyltransferase family 2 protein [Leptospiraceae bacterium]|nr:glycosyltransferase family 2 protein [Leptospiraceae bacterium]
MKDYLIAIPVYNENEFLFEVARNVIRCSGGYADLLFVNDGSTDGSTQTLELLNKEHFFVTIHKEKNEGYGSSLITSFAYAMEKNYKFLITMDCDAQHQPEDLSRFIEEDYHIDVVSGSRYLPYSKTAGILAPQDRVEINRKITEKLNRYYRYSLTDAFCGFKRIRIQSLEREIFSVKGYAFPLEFWAFTKFKSLSIKEIGVDKIYITDDRSFGMDLDYKRKRYKYYMKTWRYAHFKYFKKQLSPL